MTGIGRFRAAVIILSATFLLYGGDAVAGYFLAHLRDGLQTRLDRPVLSPEIAGNAAILCDPLLLHRFYKERDFRPAWFDQTGISTQADALIARIRRVSEDGLRPDDYHIARIEELLSLVRDSESLVSGYELFVDLDILLTDAFFACASNLLSGRVSPEITYIIWNGSTREADPVHLLNTAIGSFDVESTLDSMNPPHEGYRLLRTALARYREIIAGGGWPSVPAGPALKRGDRDDRVPSIREHLLRTGDLELNDPADPTVFDKEFEQAVRRYQKRHGILEDGVIGPVTTARLNIPAEDLAVKIILNMERWRWLPEDFGEEYIMVNIADFTLRAYRDRVVERAMRVIVGTNYRRTPIFSSVITSVILNPAWYVPAKIAVEDIIPQILRNPRYLTDRNIHVLESWRHDAPEINPATVNWETYRVYNLPYLLKQDPGPLNPLGRIKFMIPNKFDVYLHDTPQKELFENIQRGFSSGCIRIEKAVDLAAFLLRDEPDWSRKQIEESITSGKRREIKLKKQVPVHLLYWTAWVDDNGQVNFREDIYERDTILSAALHEKPPGF